MKFSIIIPTYNRCYITLAVVSNMHHLLKNTNIDYEFVVVNDGSTDETEDIFLNFKKFIPNLILVRTNKTQGTYRNPGFSRNSGAKKSTGDVLCFCDGDILHILDPLKEMLIYLKNKNIHDYYFTGLHYRLFKDKMDGPRGLNSDMPHGSWLAISKTNFMNIGGYDERFKIYGNEDQDIVQRLRRKGLTHVVLKNNLAIHPLFEGDRDIALESDALKKIQLEYQRESTIIRNTNTTWGEGKIVCDDTSSPSIVNNEQKSNKISSEINTNELYLKIDSINLAIESLLEQNNLNKKTFNLINNINQNIVSSTNNIFKAKPPENSKIKSVFQFIDGVECNNIYSDLVDFKSTTDLDHNLDLLVLSQIHRQRNLGEYLDKHIGNLKVGGQLIVICPFYSNCVGSGNTNSLWNAGYLIYNLILAGIDCKFAKVSTFRNEIQIYVKKTNRKIPTNKSLDSLVDFFPFDVYQHFNGNIQEVNWK